MFRCLALAKQNHGAWRQARPNVLTNRGLATVSTTLQFQGLGYTAVSVLQCPPAVQAHTRHLRSGPQRRLASTSSSANVATAQETAVEEGTAPDEVAGASTVPEGTTLQFKAETLELLKLVTHSLYTDKEVFVRELISNASDALEKFRFLQASGKATVVHDPDIPLSISILVDSNAKSITFTDTGVGMTREEMVNNLGTIAKSGSKEFFSQISGAAQTSNEAAQTIIGQFGVGFYSSFVVAKKVEVLSRSYLPDERGWHWVSDGQGTFTLRECTTPLTRGTQIICHLDDTVANDFANTDNITRLARKFSSFVAFPVTVAEKGNEEKAEKVTTNDALWTRDAASISDEEHTAFFRHLSNNSWGEPLYHLLYKADAPLSIKALLYVPEEAPNRFFSQPRAESDVTLHSRRVLVCKSTEKIIPKWLHFLKGVIDCDDVPLNVSRETLQDSRIIEKLSSTVVRRVLKFLKDEANKNPTKYKKFYSKYSQFIKEGILDDIQKGSQHKEALTSLLRFDSSERSAQSLVSFDDYLTKAHPSQKNIYYILASSRTAALGSPYLEQFKRRGLEVLLLYDEIDEFVMMHLSSVAGKKLVSIDTAEDQGITDDLNLVDPAPLDEAFSNRKPLSEADQNKLEEYVKKVLGEKVNCVKFSSRVVSSPAVISGFLPPCLRRMMRATVKDSEFIDDKELGNGANGTGRSMDLPVTLELNPYHPLVHLIPSVMEKDIETAHMIVEQMLDNAKMTAGVLDETRDLVTRLDKILEATALFVSQKTESSLHDKKEPHKKTLCEETAASLNTNYSVATPEIDVMASSEALENDDTEMLATENHASDSDCSSLLEQDLNIRVAFCDDDSSVDAGSGLVENTQASTPLDAEAKDLYNTEKRVTNAERIF